MQFIDCMKIDVKRIIRDGLEQRLESLKAARASAQRPARGWLRAVRNAVGLLTSLVDVDPHRAYLYLSAAADFAVSQAVDIVKGVHGAIRVSDFAEFRPGPFTDRILAAVARSLEVV